jgi:MoaA/NifB/PqqE/SkfB family radical SAM enzyme
VHFELKMLHLQLSRKCNLRCRFCGQQHTDLDGAMSLSDWIHLLRQLRKYAPGATVVLWGGEPLAYPYFREVAQFTAEQGFQMEIITNGTMLSNHADLLRSFFKTVYVSVDGPEKVHDLIRGKGVFSKVKTGLDMLKGGNAELVMMSVMAPENMDYFTTLPFGLPVDRVILHEMIYLTDAECRELPKEVTEKWHSNATPDYQKHLRQTIDNLKQIEYAIPVEFQPHLEEGKCLEPYRHLHISSDGETSFCTDFTHYTLGNVRNQSLQAIFEGEKAQLFRKNGNSPFCSHCSWKNTKDSIIKFNVSPKNNEKN